MRVRFIVRWMTVREVLAVLQAIIRRGEENEVVNSSHPSGASIPLKQ